MTINFRRVEPAGTRTAISTMECGCSRQIQVPAWPESPEGTRLREERMRLGLGLREMCVVLELSAVDCALLERGGAVCDWDEAHRLLLLAVAVGATP